MKTLASPADEASGPLDLRRSYTLLASIPEQRGLPVTDFLTEKRQQIADRLKELEPLVEEYRRLEAAAAALGKLASAPAATTTTATTTRRRPGRPRGAAKPVSKAATAASPAPTPAATPVKAAPKKAVRKARRGRRKGSGTRAAEALSAVQGQPGITIPELAAKMGIQTTYLYRVLPGLEKERKVEKKGRGWFPREG